MNAGLISEKYVQGSFFSGAVCTGYIEKITSVNNKMKITIWFTDLYRLKI